MEGQCLAMMTAVKLEVRSLQYDSSGERTFITKGTCTIYDIHILMEPITYSRTVHEAYNILQRRKEDVLVQSIEGDGVLFVQSGQ